MIFKDIKFSLRALRLRYFGGEGHLEKCDFLYGVLENAIFVWGCRKCHFCMGLSKMPFLYGGLENVNFCMGS